MKAEEKLGPETVKRYMDNVVRRCFDINTIGMASELEEAILSLDVMPSMRAMMTAGPALRQRQHIRI